MTKRNTQQRRHQIMQNIDDKGEVAVDKLAKLHQTSEVTIRKDLSALEQSGLLIRKFGGAIALPKELIADRPVNAALEAIGRAAAALIRDYNRLILDSGRTTAALIPSLNDKIGLVVMTNALESANQLLTLEHPPTLLMTGGTYDQHSESFQGAVAEHTLGSYDFDQLFIGCDGIDLDRGTTTFNELRGLSKVMAASAREVIVVAESSKIARKIPNLELPWQQISVLVTDARISPEQQQLIEAKGVTIVIADQGDI